MKFLATVAKVSVLSAVMFASTASLCLAQNETSAPTKDQQPVAHVLVQKGEKHTTSVVVNVYDGQRQLLPAGTVLLYRIIDGHNNTVFQGFVNSPSVQFEHLPFHNDGSGYRVIVALAGFDDGGVAGVDLSPDVVATVDIMVIPRHARFDFSNAHADNLAAHYPQLWRILSAGVEPDVAVGRWEHLIGERPNVAACLLNLMTAMSQMPLPSGATALDYYQGLLWDQSMEQDRFFGWVSVKLIDEIQAAAKAGLLEEEPAPGVLHPGATAAWKQVALDEANLNYTLHENDRIVVDGVEYVLFEVDIDYYKDKLAHAFGEVIPNMITGHLTDPMKVYQLRWNSGWGANLAEFSPPETIVAASRKFNLRGHQDHKNYRNLRLLKFWRYMRKGQ